MNVYVAGHDHDMQHLEFENHPTSFFISGGGGADLSNLEIGASERGPYAERVYGFSHLSVNTKQMTLRHLDPNGLSLHFFTKTPEGRVELLR